MDGPWQMGHKTASEYGRIAAETSCPMKFMDPTIETVTCGSLQSYDANLRFLGNIRFWTNAMMRWITFLYTSTTEIMQMIIVDFLASSKGMDDFISGVVAICDAVKSEKNTAKSRLTFPSMSGTYGITAMSRIRKLEKWVRAPHQLEDVYNFEDALLRRKHADHTLRHADRVKIACLAQLCQRYRLRSCDIRYRCMASDDLLSIHACKRIRPRNRLKYTGSDTGLREQNVRRSSVSRFCLHLG